MLENTFNLDINEFNYPKEALSNNNHTYQDKIMKIPDIIGYLKNSRRNSKSATGQDNIQSNHINNAPKSFKNRIIKLFNTSLTAGEVPNSWKKAELIMILKQKKTPNDKSSYRPISLKSCFAKCHQKFVQKRLLRKHYYSYITCNS
jgi:hypothetical protein